MQLGTVIVADRRGDSSLRVARVALVLIGSQRTTTRPAGASAMAARSPAIPPPTIKK
jgi:hypothetical protein